MKHIALVTGASRGLGQAAASALTERGWRLVIDARNAADLDAARSSFGDAASVTAVAGDVTDPEHRERLAAVVRAAGRLDLLVNNASELGPSPLPALARHPLGDLERVYQVNVLAPLALTQQLLPELVAASGVVVNVSSDAAVEAYPGWGGYGSSKAALDQVTAVLGAECPELRAYAFDPGDMRTAMHQRAFPARTSPIVPSRIRPSRHCCG